MRKRKGLRKVVEFFFGSLVGGLFGVVAFHLVFSSLFEPDVITVKNGERAKERECKAYEERLADASSFEEFVQLKNHYVALCGRNR